jgi:hypothetical protein
MAMETRTSTRKADAVGAYAAPSLVKHGSLRELTLTPVPVSSGGGSPWCGDGGGSTWSST